MRLVIGASKMGMAVQAGEGSSSTLTAMRIEFLLSQHVPTVLERHVYISIDGLHLHLIEGQGERISTSQEKETIVVIDQRVGSGQISGRFVS